MTNQINFAELSDQDLKKFLFEGLKEAFQRQGQVAIEAIELAEIVREEFTLQETNEASRKAKEAIQKEKAEIAAKEEAEKQQRIWAKKIEIAQNLQTVLGVSDITIKVWISSSSEKRIYINQNGKKAEGLVEYYFTGNQHWKPKSINTTKLFTKLFSYKQEQELIPLLDSIAEKWNSLSLNVETTL